MVPPKRPRGGGGGGGGGGVGGPGGGRMWERSQVGGTKPSGFFNDYTTFHVFLCMTEIAIKNLYMKNILKECKSHGAPWVLFYCSVFSCNTFYFSTT